MIYFLQSTIALLLLWLSYALFLQPLNGLFVFKRFYLLLSLVLALLFPALDLSISTTLSVPEVQVAYENFQELSDQFAESSELSLNNQQDKPFSFLQILVLLYGIVVLVLLWRFAHNLYAIQQLKNQKGPRMLGMHTALIHQKSHPFSFFNTLFIYHKEWDNVINNEAVLWHEKAHCVQLHSIDVLLVELIHCFFWFNPIFLLYKKAITGNHEFLADEYATRHLNDSQAYLNSLVHFVWTQNAWSLTSGFSYLKIKQRIAMIHQSKPNVMKKISSIGISSLTLVLIIGSCAFTLPQYTALAKIEEPGPKALVPSALPIEASAITKISSHFGMRYNPVYKVKKMHTGIDIVAEANTSILATADGVVIFAKHGKGYGNHIKIEHQNGFETMYAHLKELKVKAGEKVKVGQAIGIIGNTGRSIARHLHYEVIKNGEKVNPAVYFTYEVEERE